MKNILVGLSGGVDSSTTAALLLEQGFRVAGLTLQLSSEADEAIRDAKGVADFLGIDHYVVDAQKLFQEEVISPFVATWQEGATPNPCVRCNRKIKFGHMRAVAKDLGFEATATGHYAQIKPTADGVGLYAGADAKKDQSYFLGQIEREALPHVYFPLGGYTKEEVRRIAKEKGLPTASKSESQDICFVPQDATAAFLEGHLGTGTSTLVDEQGKKIAQGKGLWHYTIGQRKGLGVALGYPAYVSAIDAKENTVTITRDEALWKRDFVATDLNVLAPLEKEGRALCKVRSRGDKAPCHYRIEGDRLIVSFDAPARAITPGQAAVLYDKEDRVLLGAYIKDV